MFRTNPHRFSFVPLMILLFASRAVSAQDTAFTYQGRLTDNGNPGNGTYEMQFKLYDTATVGTGTQQGTTITNATVEVSGGIFTVQLDFGAGVFDGSSRYLEVSIRPGGSSDPYVLLEPRQPVSSTPYAIRSVTSVNATQLGGLPASGFIQNGTTQQVATNFNISGNGTLGGTLSAGSINAASQYNLGGSRLLAGTANNLFLGLSAGTANTTGTFNTFVGSLAGTSNTTGTSNSFFGPSAGLSNQTGTDNSFFGRDAGFNTNASFNSFFGSFSGRENTTGFNNSSFGAFAGHLNTSGTDNSSFGTAAGLSNTGSFNSFFGSLAGRNNTSGSENSFFGASAGKVNTTGLQNSFFGSGAGFSNTTGSGNAFFGHHAGLSNTSSSNNSFFGASAGATNTTGIGNSFFGFRAGLNTTANFNSFFGVSAGEANAIGADNSFFGAAAGQLNSSGFANSFFGTAAGIANVDGFNNSFFGRSAGLRSGQGSNNSFFGAFAGEFNTTGGGNTFLGRSAGHSNTIENNNTFIGYQSNGNPGITNATAIGANAVVTQSNSLVLGNSVRVGISTSLPHARLDVVDTASQIRFGSSLFDQGGFLTSANASQADLSGGAKWSGSSWIATGPSASVMELVSGDITFSNAVGLINGFPFSFTEQMRITSGGRVGIGVALPADKLEVAGDIRIGTGGNGCVRSSNGTVIAGACSSDVRLKQSIRSFSPTLDKLVRLQPVYFYWRAEEYPEKGFGHELSFGLIAQDVERVMPDLVAEDEKGFKLVRYHKLPFVMLQAIKDLRAEKDEEVAALKSENAALKKQNADFEARLRRLERAFQNKVASRKTRAKRLIKPTPGQTLNREIRGLPPSCAGRLRLPIATLTPKEQL